MASADQLTHNELQLHDSITIPVRLAHY